MFSKRPFIGPRRPVNNPTREINSPHPPTTSDPVHDKYIKDLPALPNDSHTSLQLESKHDMTSNTHSDVSPVGSPLPHHDRRDSQSSFCVSPIGDGDQFPHYPPSMSPTPILREKNVDIQSKPRLQPVQEPRRVISGKPTYENDFLGEPTTNEVDRITQVNPRNTPFHKPTTSHTSNIFKQFHPKKTFTAARNRISSISKTEDYPKETRVRSSSRGFPVEDHSAKRNGTSNASPQLHNLTFASTTVTTITSGGPAVSLPTRPATERAPSHPREDTPEFKFDDEVISMMLPSNEPMSRFSATTYNTTEPNSQNPSPRESMQLDTRSTDDLSTSSIMGRRRPVAPVGLPTSKKPIANNKPVRKPTPSQVAEQIKQLPVQSSLPPSEEPMDAHGRIEAMQDKRDELTRRRYTLETVIAELMKVFQPNSPVVYDKAAKDEVQKSVTSMENEIADIKKEEHDLGMKITRAWRRLDEKENAGDGNNLWVKRVTS